MHQFVLESVTCKFIFNDRVWMKQSIVPKLKQLEIYLIEFNPRVTTALLSHRSIRVKKMTNEIIMCLMQKTTLQFVSYIIQRGKYENFSVHRPYMKPEIKHMSECSRSRAVLFILLMFLHADVLQVCCSPTMRPACYCDIQTPIKHRL